MKSPGSLHSPSIHPLGRALLLLAAFAQSLASDAPVPGRTFNAAGGTSGSLHYQNFSAIGGIYGAAASSSARITIQNGFLPDFLENSSSAPPLITVQPVNQTVLPGQNVLFTVNATGSSPFVYQWKKDGTNIPAANQEQFLLKSAQTIDAGVYSVLISNSASSVTSENAILTFATGLPGTIDFAFDFSNGSDGEIYCSATQDDGSVFIGGEFHDVGGVSRFRFARIQPDGLLDAGYLPPSFGDAVLAIGIQSDQHAIIGGMFTIPSPFLVRLAPSGARDAAFSANASVNGTIRGLLVQPDDKVVVVGTFKTAGGIARTNVARFHPNGLVDSTFVADAPGAVYTVARQQDGKLLLGGEFTTVNGIARSRLARLNVDGTVDPGFNPGNVTAGSGSVSTMALEPGQEVLFPGGFKTIDGKTYRQLIRLDQTGAIVNAFNVLAWAPFQPGITAIALQSNGKILIGGNFTSVNGRDAGRIARLNRDGSVDTTFNPGVGANDTVYTISLEGNRSILIGGAFTMVNGQSRQRLARLNSGEMSAPKIVIQPATQTVTPGANLYLEVVSTGTPPLSYQWRKNHSDLPGQTNSVLRFASISSEDSGLYEASVQNAVGSIPSDPASIVVSENDPPLYLTALRLVDGRVHLQITGPPAREYLIETTSDLNDNWATLLRITPVTLPFQFIDDGSSALAMRFYRARLVQ